MTWSTPILKIEPILLLFTTSVVKIFNNLRHWNLACFKQLQIHFFLSFQSYQLRIFILFYNRLILNEKKQSATLAYFSLNVA